MAVGQYTDCYVQVDETPIKYLAPGKGKTAQGYLLRAELISYCFTKLIS